MMDGIVKFLKVKYAFLGCSLERGTKYIAFGHVTFYVLFFLYILVVDTTATSNEEEALVQHMIPPPIGVLAATNATSSNMTEFLEDDNSSELNSNQTMVNGSISEITIEREIFRDAFIDLSATYFNAYVTIIQIVFGVYLIIGVRDKIPDYLATWLILQVTQTFLSQFFVIVYFIAIFHVHSPMLVYLVFDEITFTFVELYFIAIVLSYYNQLRKESQDEYLSPIIRNCQEDTISPIVINSTPNSR